MRFVQITIIALLLGSGSKAQTAPAAQPSRAQETGSTTDGKYTNPFFGFSLPLPEDASLRNITLPYNDTRKEFLFGLQGQDHGFVSFIVTAIRADSASSDDAKREVSDSRAGVPNKVMIGGRQFWRSEFLDKEPAGKMQNVEYATPLGNSLLKFTINSLDPKITLELEHSVESMTFFDPTKGKDKGGPGNKQGGQFLPMAAITSSVNSWIVAFPPASGVKCFPAR